MDYKLIGHLADAGYAFAPCSAGMTRSTLARWPDLATSNKETIKQWLKDGKSLVSVAKRGHHYIIDIDDPMEAYKQGFRMEWLDGMFIVDTPSGGIHASGLHDAISNALPFSFMNVRAEKNNPKSKLIVELKLNAASTAARSAERFGIKGKKNGLYTPRAPFSGVVSGINRDLLEWVKVNMDDKAPASMHSPFKGFHPDFDVDEFLENECCSEFASGIVDGAYHVVVDECPICGKLAVNSTLRAGITKFIFGGTGVGFICHACGVRTFDDYLTEMDNTYTDYEPWAKEKYIYKMDDPQLQAAKWGNLVDLTNEPDEEPELEPEIAAILNDDVVEPKASGGSIVMDVEENKDWTREFRVRTADSVETEEIKWLWPQKFPLAMLGLVNGKQDTGKSTFLVDLAARTSTGADWPDGAKNEHGARRVLFCASEDSEGNTLVPRLIAAGADLSKILFPERVTLTMKVGGKKNRELFNMKQHLTVLARTLLANPDIAVVILDPLVSYVGDNNIMKEEEMKPFMDSLKRLAEKTGVAIIYLVHSSKRSDVDAQGKVMGAACISGTARVAWTFGKDAEDETLCRMGVIKGNIIVKKSGLEYRLVSADVDIKGRKSSQARIQWGAESNKTADDMLTADRQKARGGDEDSASNLAIAVLRETVFPHFSPSVAIEL